MNNDDDRILGLIYASRPADGLREADVVSLAISAAAHNQAKGLTGCLWFHDRLFVQALEGPSHEIDALYQRIRADHRHEQVTTIECSPIPARCFGDWSFKLMRAGRRPQDEQLWLLASNLIHYPVWPGCDKTPVHEPIRTSRASASDTIVQWLQEKLVWSMAEKLGQLS